MTISGYNEAVIGILADSHDNLSALGRAVRLFNGADCDLVIHAGDFVAPFAARELGGLACAVKAVYGNCDGERKGLRAAFEGLGEIAPAPLGFEHAGRRFLVAHLGVPAARALGARPPDVVVVGHTHKPEVRRDGGLLVVNPGEAGGWLHGRSTVALLDPRDLSVEILTL